MTVGLIQWSVPLNLAGPWHYAAFRPRQIAPWLDFLEVHFYPLDGGAYHYENAEAERRNLAYCMRWFARRPRRASRSCWPSSAGTGAASPRWMVGPGPPPARPTRRGGAGAVETTGAAWQPDGSTGDV